MAQQFLSIKHGGASNGKGGGGKGGGGKGGGGKGGNGSGKQSNMACRDFRSTGTCARGVNCRFKHSQVIEGGRRGGDGSGGGGGAGTESLELVPGQLWEPPVEELQHINVPRGDGGGVYTLIFPLKVATEDYARRSLEIVARGIGGPVARITKETNLADFLGDSRNDVYYLLKQILAPRLHGGDQLAHRTAFLATGSSHIATLVDAAEHLLEQRNALFHLAPDSARLADLDNSTRAAELLLLNFGAPAAAALAELEVLVRQVDLHRQFKEARMRALGWTWGGTEACTTEARAAEAGAAEAGTAEAGTAEVGGGDGRDEAAALESSHAALTGALKAATAPPEAAAASLARLLRELSGQVAASEKAASAASNYPEAERLRDLAAALESAVGEDGQRRLDNARRLVFEAEKQVAGWRLLERASSDRGAYGEAERAKKAADVLFALAEKVRGLYARGGRPPALPEPVTAPRLVAFAAPGGSVLDLVRVVRGGRLAGAAEVAARVCRLPGFTLEGLWSAGFTEEELKASGGFAAEIEVKAIAEAKTATEATTVSEATTAAAKAAKAAAEAKVKAKAKAAAEAKAIAEAKVATEAKAGADSKLIVAAKEGNVKLVELLLADGADANIQDKDGTSVCFIALSQGYADIVALLRANGAVLSPEVEELAQAMAAGQAAKEVDPAKAREASAALLKAAEKGDLKQILLLIYVLGADINTRDGDGWTALYWAATKGHAATVEALVKAGANIDLKILDGRTALISAALMGHTAIVEALVKAGANIGLQDSDGCTALTKATANGHIAMSKALVKAGAKLDLHDSDRAVDKDANEGS